MPEPTRKELLARIAELEKEVTRTPLTSTRAVLLSLIDGGNMPRQRHQSCKPKQNANGSWYIRPYVDVITQAGIEPTITPASP
jgi:hypothetical protein